MKPHIKNLKCFPQVAAVIGESRAQLELWKVVHCDGSSVFCDRALGYRPFYFHETPQGLLFWWTILKGKNPYTSGHLPK